MPSIRRTVSDRDTPPTSAPLLAPTRAAQVVGPLEQAGDPAGLLGPWRPFGNLTHPLSASPELAGSRELARGSQSFRGSRGSAAVAGCEEGLAEAPGQGAEATVGLGSGRVSTGRPPLPPAPAPADHNSAFLFLWPETRPGPLGGAGRDANRSGV